MRRFGLSAVRQQVLDACLTCWSTDTQCEGGRGAWLAEFLGVEDRDEALASIRGAVEGRPADQVTRRELSLLLAQQGHPMARETLQGLLGWCSCGCGAWEGVAELVELDGAAGLRFALRTLQPNLSSGQVESVRVLANNFDPDVDAARLLREECPWFPDGSEPTSTPAPGGELTVPDLLAKAAGQEPIYWPARWAKQASRQELQQVQAELEVATRPGHLFNLLGAFQWRRFPQLTPGLMKLMEHPDRAVRLRVVRILSQHRHVRVRQAALRSLRQRRLEEGQLLLLLRNFQDGDEQLLEPLLVVQDDREADHCRIFELQKLCEELDPWVLENVLWFIHETSPCRNCRRTACERLQLAGLFPFWARREDALDPWWFE